MQDPDRELGSKHQVELVLLDMSRLRRAGRAFRPGRHAVRSRDFTQTSIGWVVHNLISGWARWAVFGGRRKRASRIIRRSANEPAPSGRGRNSVRGASTHPEAVGDRRQRLLEVGPGQRPPELVGVVVDDPVRSHLVRHPPDLGGALLQDLEQRTRHADQSQDAGSLVGLENLPRAVGGAIVQRDEEVDPLRPVEAEVVLDHVRLVADHDGHRELHREVTSPGGVPLSNEVSLNRRRRLLQRFQARRSG